MITTALVGDLFIVMDPNGDLVTTVGGQQTLNFQQIFSLLKANSGDYYDTMSCYLDTSSGVLNLGAAAGVVYQDVSGIGSWTFDSRSQWSSTRLQHYSYYSQFDLVTFLQEFGHRWGARVKYATTPNTPGQTLLHQDWIWTPGGEGAHWGRWFDDGNSSMDYDQAEWIDNGNGTYNRIDRDTTVSAQAAWFGYCPLDQYLMGLIPDSAVAPMKVLQNPSPPLSELGPSGVPTGPYTPSAITTVTIAQIQNPKSDDPSPVFSGPRNPDYLSSQRVFHNAIVVVTKNTSTATAFITNSETWRQAHTANVRKVTSGRMMVDTSLLRSNFTDIYVKDNPADTGAGSSTGTFWETPDLVTRNIDDNVFADVPVIRNQDNWIYVRVRNKGATTYANVTVNVYLANFVGTEFLYPVDWAPTPNNFIGTATIASLPAASGGNDGTAIAKFLWSAAQIPPATGWHPCLLAEVIPMEITPSGLHHVWENRKLAQKNVTIIDTMTTKSLLINFEFAIGHPLRTVEGTHLQFAAEDHTSDIRLFLDPAGLVDDIATHATKVAWDIPLDPSRIPSGEHGVQEIDATHGPQVIDHAPSDDGLVIEINRGTEIGIGGEHNDGLRLRFEDDVRIRIGGSPRALEHRHTMRGLRPVVLNGLPLLEITDMRQASLSLPLPPGERRTLQLYAIMTRPLPHPARYQITERLADRVIGGATLQLGV
jgi:hypothetical protein